MKRAHPSLICLYVTFTYLILASCTAVRVNYDYDKATDFSNYTTYNYYPELSTGLNQLDDRRLIKAIDSVMQSRGLLLSEEPDFLINILSSSFQGPGGSAVGIGVGGTGGNMGGGVSIGLPLGRGNVEREIVFDLVDSQKDALIWQAVSTSSYSENAIPKERERKLREVVNKVFTKYPPKK